MQSQCVGERAVERVDGEEWKSAYPIGKPPNKNLLVLSCPAFLPTLGGSASDPSEIKHQSRKLAPPSLRPPKVGELGGQYGLRPPLEEEAQAHFFFHGLGPRQQRPIEVARPYGRQIHSSRCQLQCGMQLAGQAYCLPDVSGHMCLCTSRGTSTAEGRVRGGKQPVK